MNIHIEMDIIHFSLHKTRNRLEHPEREQDAQSCP